MKNITIESQFGGINQNNTCYLNTAVQNLLVHPDLSAIITSRKKELLNKTHIANKMAIINLCNFLTSVIEKQQGVTITNKKINDFWVKFVCSFRKIVIDDKLVGNDQQDAQEAYQQLNCLLNIQPCVQEQKKKFLVQ